MYDPFSENYIIVQVYGLQGMANMQQDVYTPLLNELYDIKLRNIIIVTRQSDDNKEKIKKFID